MPIPSNDGTFLFPSALPERRKKEPRLRATTFPPEELEDDGIYFGVALRASTPRFRAAQERRPAFPGPQQHTA